jgi:hypothetical protein
MSNYTQGNQRPKAGLAVVVGWSLDEDKAGNIKNIKYSSTYPSAYRLSRIRRS